MLRRLRSRRALVRFLQKLLAPLPSLALQARVGASAAFVFSISACLGPTSQGRLDESVQEMNVAARFGRNDVATEHVAAKARPDFIKNHKGWGHDIQVVEVEMGGVEKMTDREAIVLVAYGWYRPTDGRLRTTTVRQTWKSVDGPWWLTNEESASGDPGLFGGAAVTPVVVDTSARYRTTSIPGE